MLGLALDVTDRADEFDVIAQAVESFGRIDVGSTMPVTCCKGPSRSSVRSRSATNSRRTLRRLVVRPGGHPGHARPAPGTLHQHLVGAGDTGIPMAGKYCAGTWALEGAAKHSLPN